MSQDYQIGALWIGGSLSFLEQLCLKSFVDAGHHVKLFTYGEVKNVPDDIEIADANTILPDEKTIRHTRTGSPAPQADRFRYHMLSQHDDIIWADTDAYCVQPFTTDSGYFFGWESAHHVNNGVLGLPSDSDTLGELVEFTSDEFAIPEWLPSGEQDRLRAAKEAGTPVGVGDQAWGAWGPQALTHFLHKTGEIRYALPVEALYPIGFKERGIMVRAGANAERHLTAQTLSIHFYGRRMRDRINNEGGVPPRDSLIGRLLEKHDIKVEDAPLPAPPPKLTPLDPGARKGRGAINLTDMADEIGSDRGSVRHGFTDLYQMLFLPLRQRKLRVALLGLDSNLAADGFDDWKEAAQKTLNMWLDYFPKAEFVAFDMQKEAPLKNDRLTYLQSNFDNPGELAAMMPEPPDIVIDDGTHASHHQQNGIRAFFPKLASGGLYVAEDLRSQPASLERHGLVKTAALFQAFLNAGLFEHPDDKANSELNDMRVDISGCFLFQAKFQKHRRDQILVLHKR